MNVVWGFIHSMDEAPPGTSCFDDDAFTREEDTNEGRDPEQYRDDWGLSLVSHNTFDYDCYRSGHGKEDSAYTSDSFRILEWTSASPR